MNKGTEEAADALLKAGALQSAIFNSANFSSIATDAKGVIQIFNVGAERMLGYAAVEVVNKITPADISDPEELIVRARALSVEHETSITPGFEALVFKASRGIEDIYELTYIRKDGSRFPAVVSVTALRDAQDVIIGYLLIGTDNTARKQAEGKLLLQTREANEKLALTRQRAYELAEEARAAKALRAANRTKDEFLAMLGHELRNPLAPILTALDLMSMRDPSAFQRERGIIRRHLDHLIHLVDDLLDISRITEGKFDLQREPIEIAEVVARAVEMASPLLEQKTQELTVSVTARGLGVDGDPDRLAQVVANLLINAAKYTPARGTIGITGERRGTSVVIRVRDSGIGISAEMLPRVFDLFAQERQTLDRTEGGLGLGLAIVKSLVAMHRGTATAHSDGLGRGSTFEIELPAWIGDVHEGEGAGLNEAAVHGDHPVASCKILVVDDNRDSAELTAEFLAKHGHEVRVAFDGPTALALVQGFVPDVALLDIGLPVMDGYELATRLRAVLAPHETRFIAITGYGTMIERSRSLTAGFALHLVKPVDVNTLQASIDRVMDVPPLRSASS